MTREEFFNEITCFEDVRDMCNEHGYNFPEIDDIYGTTEMDEYVCDHIQSMASDYYWHEIRDYLDNLSDNSTTGFFYKDGDDFYSFSEDDEQGVISSFLIFLEENGYIEDDSGVDIELDESMPGNSINYYPEDMEDDRQEDEFEADIRELMEISNHEYQKLKVV